MSDSPPPSANDRCSEQQIAEALWSWADAPPDARTIDAGFNSVRHLMESLDSYWDGILGHLPAELRRGNWWCDGCVDNTVSQLDATVFCVDGIMWLGKGADMFPAPYELVFSFTHRLDTSPRHVIARVGDLDASGQIRRNQSFTHAQEFLMRRPHPDRSWAIAVDVSG